MAARNVLIELAYSGALEVAAWSAAENSYAETETGPAFAGMVVQAIPAIAKAVPPIAGLSMDPSFPPVAVPGLVPREAPDDPTDVGALLAMASGPASSTYVVRGQVEAADVPAMEKAAAATGAVVQTYVDPTIQVCRLCSGSPPLWVRSGRRTVARCRAASRS